MEIFACALIICAFVGGTYFGHWITKTKKPMAKANVIEDKKGISPEKQLDNLMNYRGKNSGE